MRDERHTGIVIREPRPIAGRVPPNDPVSEESVLSACLSDTDAADAAIAVLEPRHFYSEQHQAIFRAIVELRAQGKPIDFVVVNAWLREHDLTVTVTVADLSRLVDATPAVPHVMTHAKSVHQTWQRRLIIATCQTFAAHGYDVVLDHDRYVSECDAAMTTALAVQMKRAESERINVTLKTVMTKMMDPADDPEIRSTGLADLDVKLGGGLFPGDLTIIAARPGAGKTSLLDHIEVAVAERFGEVVSWTGEMPKEQRAMRKLCARSGIDIKRFRSKHIRSNVDDPEKDEWAMLAHAAAFLARLPIEVDETPTATLVHVASLARRRQRRALVGNAQGRGIGVITGDHIGIMGTRDRGNRNLELGEISAGLKALAKELHVPVVWLCQLNRGVESRQNKRPTMADIRECGRIEEDADNIILMYRDSYYRADSPEPNVVELDVAKQRNGDTGVVKVAFQKECTRFGNLSHDSYGDDRWQN